MAKADRETRKRWQSDVARRAATVLKTGMPKQSSLLDVAAAAAAITRNASGPAMIAARAHDLFEVSVRQAMPRMPLACAKGCAYCCHSIVSVMAPEAFRLAAAVRSAGDLAIGRFRAGARITANRTAGDRFGARQPCPLLVDGACSVYAARPLACRSVTAIDVAPCIEEFEGRDGDIDVPAHHLAHAVNAKAALAIATSAATRPGLHYELSAAVLRVLDQPDAETRWAAGEDVFHGVLVDREAEAAIEGVREKLAERDGGKRNAAERHGQG